MLEQRDTEFAKGVVLINFVFQRLMLLVVNTFKVFRLETLLKLIFLLANIQVNMLVGLLSDSDRALSCNYRLKSLM